jgi:hypothetical protein
MTESLKMSLRLKNNPILKLLKKYNIRTLSVKIKEKQRLSRVNILLSYQAVETKYGYIFSTVSKYPKQLPRLP